MKEIFGNISSIETGFVDGPGVRAVVYMQGCPLRCLYCHNPETWNAKEEKNKITPFKLIEKLNRYKPYFGEEGGVTFSGGEPLMQQDFLLEALRLCKKNGLNTAIDTSGCAEIKNEFLNYVDLVILDIKATNDQDFMNLTGGNMSLFNLFLSTCPQKNKPLWIRHVVVPGVNDKKEDILKLKNFISTIKNVQRVELLPYHDMGKQKYKKLGIKYRLENTPAMDLNRIKELEKILWG